jgi:hypothetical protein
MKANFFTNSNMNQTVQAPPMMDFNELLKKNRDVSFLEKLEQKQQNLTRSKL